MQFPIGASEFTFPRSASGNARVFTRAAADHVGPICAVGASYGTGEIRKNPIAVGIAECAVPFDRSLPIGEVKRSKTVCRPQMQRPIAFVVERSTRSSRVSLNPLLGYLHYFRTIPPAGMKRDTSGFGQLLSVDPEITKPSTVRIVTSCYVDSQRQFLRQAHPDR